MCDFNPVELIINKREGKSLSTQEINFLVDAFTRGDLPEYQMSSLLMAIFFKGLSLRETRDLTLSYLNSGEKIIFSDSLTTVDKHSTGGVGDKISFIMAPLIACLNLNMPMIAGRGLGHTGGTIDKLESIPGLKTSLNIQEFKEYVIKNSFAIMGQTSSLVPADKQIYALRDVTGTVECLELITASILSKKIAEGARYLVIDLKVGSGAFVKSLNKAKELGNFLKLTGEELGIKVDIVYTNMNQPLGFAIGNALEIKEAIDIMSAKINLVDISVVVKELTYRVLKMTGITTDRENIFKSIEKLIKNGSVLEKFLGFIEQQKGILDLNSENYGLEISDRIFEIKAKRTGWVKSINTREIGFALIILGGGRKNMLSKVDHSVGLEVFVKIGDKIKQHDTVAKVFYKKESELERAVEKVEKSITISRKKQTHQDIILS